MEILVLNRGRTIGSRQHGKERNETEMMEIIEWPCEDSGTRTALMKVNKLLSMGVESYLCTRRQGLCLRLVWVGRMNGSTHTGV